MARRVRSSKLESASARAQLPISTKPTWVRLMPHAKIGYRRNQAGGTWSIKYIPPKGEGSEWIRKLGPADDNGSESGMSFWAAQAEARKLIAGEQGGKTEVTDAPVSVSGAVDAYERELASRQGDVSNAKRLRKHIGAGLAGKPVSVLRASDLVAFRDSLVAKELKNAGANRIMKALKACLNQAARNDDRITNGKAWKHGLRALPVGDDGARRCILEDVEVRRVVAAAYEVDRQFGLFIEVLATCGCRASQAARLRIADLDPQRMRLSVPRSRKGKPGAERANVPVPIPASLVRTLEQASKGRKPDQLLLVQADGSAWGSRDMELPFRDAAVAAGLEPSITAYSLRHSSIVRMLMRHIPISLVASLHDTSEAAIRAHYARWITDLADVARGAMLDLSPDNVVPLKVA